MRIELSSVQKRFGRLSVLDGITLEVPPGARVGLVGPNGSGKTTLLRALMGILACDGTIRIGGRDPHAERDLVAPHVAYVPQTAPNLAAPVAEVIDAIARVRGVPSSAVVDVAREMDLDVAAVAERPFRSLSGGMKQKVLVALALAAPVSLLLLDEPTASLDGAARLRFFRLFERLPKETTLVLCSHRLEEMRHLVDTVVALEAGAIAYAGPASQFLDGASMSIVQVHVRDGADATPLRRRGFSPGVAGWWARTVTQGEKAALLPALSRELGDDIRHLLVRELELVEAKTEARDA